MGRSILVPVAVVILLFSGASVTWAGIWKPVPEGFIPELQMQLRGAIGVAEQAQKSQDYGTAQRLMLQVINCLEGPNGSNFLPDFGNPCKGRGILPDLRRLWGARGPDKMSPKYEVAVRAADVAWYTAMNGVEQKDLRSVQRFAKMTSLQLQTALEALGP